MRVPQKYRQVRDRPLSTPRWGWSRQKAVPLIQAHIRGYLQRRRYAKNKAQAHESATKIQAGEGSSIKYIPVGGGRQKAGPLIQAHIRGYLQRRRYGKYKAQAHESATKIQADESLV